MLRPSSHEASCSHGHTRSPDGAAVTLAERACGKTDWLDPPGMPRSYRRLRRGPPAPHPCGLRRLLQRTPNASVPGQGFAVPSTGATARSAHCSAHPGRASPSILPDVVFGRHNQFLWCSIQFCGRSMKPSPRAGVGQGAVMDWARILAYVTGTVDQELLVRNEYLAAENSILKAQLNGRLKLLDAERKMLGE